MRVTFNNNPSQNRNYFIDYLRFFAAFVVVIFHLNQFIDPIDNAYRNLIKYGWLGVPIFFVISGYCIIISAEKSINFYSFLKKRFFRIFPVYWLSIFIVLISAIIQKIITGYNSIANIPNTLKKIIATITLTTEPFSQIKTINWVYWSLTYEVFFYIVIGLILIFNKKFIPFFLIVLSFLSCLNLSSVINLLFFLDNWPIFSLGITAYYLSSPTSKKERIFIIIFFLVNSFACFINFKHQVPYLSVSFLTFLFIIISTLFPFKKNIVSNLGQYSYSVYLIHIPIGVYVLGRYKATYIQQNMFLNILFDIAVYLLISLISKYIYNYIEKPLIRYSQS